MSIIGKEVLVETELTDVADYMFVAMMKRLRMAVTPILYGLELMANRFNSIALTTVISDRL